MKLGITRDRFEDQVRRGIYEAAKNRNTQEKIINKLANKGYKIADISDIFEENIKLTTLSLMDLGVIASVLYDELDLSYVDPKLYLTDVELEQVQRYEIKTTNNKVKFPIVFEDCLQTASDMWITKLNVREIARLFRGNVVRYNFEMQREPRQVWSGDSIILAPDVVWSAVEEIEDELINGTFIPNTITLNIRDAESKYDNKRQRLILINGKLDIIDGFHRSLAIIGALRKKNISYTFEVRFTNFNKDKARRFIVQEDKRNPISKEYLQSIDETDLITGIVNSLNEDSKSELRGLITTDADTIREGYSLVSFEMMYEAINELWKPVTIKEAEQISEYLKDFFNKLVFLYPNELKLHIKESRKHNQINDERMFPLYLVLAKLLEESQKRDFELEDIISKIANTDEFKDYIKTTPSVIKRRMKHHIEKVMKITERVI